MAASGIVTLLMKDDTVDCMQIHRDWEAESEAHLLKSKSAVKGEERMADMNVAEDWEVGLRHA
jgi:hypothetical protein